MNTKRNKVELGVTDQQIQSKNEMKRMDRESVEWQKAANSLARDFCPPIKSCADCGGPVINGYCCTRCGSPEP
jgi:hypothetical protein